VCVALSSAAARADECTRYHDSVYHYSICAPNDWKKTFKKDGDRHYLTFRRGSSAVTEISVTASPVGGEDIPDGSDWKKWHSGRISSGFRKITETKELVSDDTIRVKLVLFDYYSRGVRILQRTMLSRYGDTQMVIECRAPLHSFGTYTEIFNMVMSSVDYSGTVTGKAVDEPDEEKAVPAKQPEPKKPAAPKKQASPKKPAGSVKQAEPKHDSTLSKSKKEKDASSLMESGGDKHGSSPAKPEEIKGDTGLTKKQETVRDVESGMGTGSRKGENMDVDVESIKDPEAKKIIEKELNTLQEMQQKGLIEKVEEEK
jgi:hypothetical protein